MALHPLPPKFLSNSCLFDTLQYVFKRSCLRMSSRGSKPADLTISTTQLPEVTPPYLIVHFLHHYMICKLKTKPCNDNDNA